MKLKILSVVAARPNFMKIAPFIRAIEAHNEKQGSLKPGTDPVFIEHILVHTGQHYDENMSAEFIRELNIPEPDINLGVGSGTHAEQVGQTMIEFEKVLKKLRPDWVVVVGDVNATMACAITAKKEQIKCCHIEAGLRSLDMTMPEEINRIVTDRLCDLLLTPDTLSSKNLTDEGISEQRIKFVGNIMIDTLETHLPIARNLDISEIIKNNLLLDKEVPAAVRDSHYALLTLHRPSNVDNREFLSQFVEFIIDAIIPSLPIIWPIHPRTVKQLEEFGLMNQLKKTNNLFLLNPISYLGMLRLNLSARIMLTDSGGLQEECTVLGTPCLTLRPNTERPVTLLDNGGVCVLVNNNIELIRRAYHDHILKKREPQRPDLWDGFTAQRCVDQLISLQDSIN